MDTEGLVLKAKVHSAKVPDQDGLGRLFESAPRAEASHLNHLWVVATREEASGGRKKLWA